MTPVRELCEVLERRRAGAYQSLTLVAPRIAEAARPGQFVHLLAGEDRSFPLRRPLSIHRVEPPGTVEVVFDVVGAGTLALSRLRPHDLVDTLGPLGRPFTPPGELAGCLLVGGGYGTAPLFFLATELRARRCRVDFVVGAATSARLLDAMEAKRLGHSLTVTTDDGSAGRRGLVTAGVPCQVAVEEHMACGTGICFTCVLPVTGVGETRMARSCLEGPVFDGAAVAWAELGYPELEPSR